MWIKIFLKVWNNEGKTPLKCFEKKKPYKCTICDYNCAFKSVLANHVSRVHEGIKQYVCEICGTRFVNNSKLIAHITTNHEGKKPFICKISASSFICSKE